MLQAFVTYVGVLVGTVLLSYFVLGFVSFVVYRPQQAEQRADDVTFVIPTIGSSAVRESLIHCLNYHTSRFPDYEIYCVTDEGADLVEKLRAYDGVKTLVVPDSYECNAVAKGRAMQYFIDNVVTEDPTGWYSFIDDDNLVQDDSFLYEIPYYEERGYGAMNSILTPRKGNSTITFVMDHIRLLDDLTVFRAFTGMFGQPYIGFHGELLTVRGDILLDIGFDRHSIVEDYAFAAELIKEGIPTWQSSTRVSILSPHSVLDLLKQRSRWFIGTWNLIGKTSPMTQLVTGIRLLSWTVALIAGPIAFIVGFLPSVVSLPFAFRVAPFLAGLVYGGTYLYGVFKLSGWKQIQMVACIPLYVVFEASTPVYAMLFADRNFEVIDK